MRQTVGPRFCARSHPESTYAPRGREGGRRKAYESVLGGGGVNALAYVRFEKNYTSNCCSPTHIRVSYSFLRPSFETKCRFPLGLSAPIQ